MKTETESVIDYEKIYDSIENKNDGNFTTDCMKEAVKQSRRPIKLAISSINGSLDGLELDTTNDVIEKSVVIELLNKIKSILS